MAFPLNRYVLAGLAFSLTACGSTEAPTEGAPAEAATAASELAGVEVVQRNADGTPAFVRGGLGRALPSSRSAADSGAEERVRPALPDIARLFRLDPAELVLLRVGRDELGNTYVRYQQRLNGLDVVGGQLLVHVDANDGIFAANGTARGGARPSALPALTVETALEAARVDAVEYGGRVHEESARRVYLRPDEDAALRLAYEVRVTAPRREGLPVDDLVYVDALEGAILAKAPRVHSALNRRMYDAMSTENLPGTLRRSEGGAATGDSHLDTNYTLLGTSYNCYSTNLGRDSYNAAGAALISTVHWGMSEVNAYWDPNIKQLIFGDGDGVTSGPLGKALDVVAHELTHAVTQAESDLTYINESGGMNEAMSDIMGAYCESWSRTWAVDSKTWLLGEDVWTPATANDALRYMANPTQDGVSLDYYPDYATGVDVHYSSGIANLAFKLLVTGGTHPRSKTSVNVTGIGMQKAGKIFYEANANCLAAGSGFSAARTCTEQKAAQFYDAATATAVSQAWAAVGVSAAPAAAFIIDNASSFNDPNRVRFQASTNWVAGANAGYYGNGYVVGTTASVSDPATFWFLMDSAGTKTVEAWWVSATNRSSSAPFIMYNAAGTQLGTVNVNQQLNGSRWVVLGTYNFTAGWNRVVLSRWTAAGTVVIADAVRVR